MEKTQSAMTDPATESGAAPLGFPRIDVLGFPVAQCERATLADSLLSTRPSSAAVIANLNLHGLYMLRRDPFMKRVIEGAELVHADGMPIVWLGALSGGSLGRENRITYIDLLPELFRPRLRPAPRVFLLGGEESLGKKVMARLTSDWPGLEFRHHHGFFDAEPGSADNGALVAQIESFQPEFLFVAMGMPRQERWIAEHIDRLPPCWVLPSGAGFHYYSGVIKSPPRWAGRLGLEWLYRFAAEPRRLWWRYVVEPLSLAPWVVQEVIAARARGRGDATSESS